MASKLEISICPIEPRASVDTDLDPFGAIKDDLADCCRSGDCEEACRYVLTQYAPTFNIWDAGKAVHREATEAELEATCKAIYFESESDFSDSDTAALYLIWEAANQEEDS